MTPLDAARFNRTGLPKRRFRSTAVVSPFCALVGTDSKKHGKKTRFNLSGRLPLPYRLLRTRYSYYDRIFSFLLAYRITVRNNFSQYVPGILQQRWPLYKAGCRYSAGNTGTAAATGTNPHADATRCSHTCQAISQAL